jgi:hypothetical protein
LLILVGNPSLATGSALYLLLIFDLGIILPSMKSPLLSAAFSRFHSSGEWIKEKGQLNLGGGVYEKA